MANVDYSHGIELSHSAKAASRAIGLLAVSLWMLLVLGVPAGAAPSLQASTEPVELYNTSRVAAWSTEGYYYVGGLEEEVWRVNN